MSQWGLTCSPQVICAGTRPAWAAPQRRQTSRPPGSALYTGLDRAGHAEGRDRASASLGRRLARALCQQHVPNSGLIPAFRISRPKEEAAEVFWPF